MNQDKESDESMQPVSSRRLNQNLHESWKKFKPVLDKNSVNVSAAYDCGYINGASDFQYRILEAIEKDGPFLSTDYIKQLILNLKK